MDNKFQIFYSWRSDIRSNTNLIHNAIEKEIKALRREDSNEIKLETNLVRDI